VREGRSEEFEGFEEFKEFEVGKDGKDGKHGKGAEWWGSPGEQILYAGETPGQRRGRRGLLRFGMEVLQVCPSS
jgi:hypothetical protein